MRSADELDAAETRADERAAEERRYADELDHSATITSQRKQQQADDEKRATDAWNRVESRYENARQRAAAAGLENEHQTAFEMLELRDSADSSNVNTARGLLHNAVKKRLEGSRHVQGLNRRLRDGLRPGGLVPPRGSFFFESQSQASERHPDGRFTTVNAQKRMQLLGRGIGMMSGQLRQLLKIDLDNSGPAPWPRLRLASFPAPLFHPPRPGPTDLKQVGNLLRLQAAVVRRQHAIPQILTVSNTHPWLLSGPLIEP